MSDLVTDSADTFRSSFRANGHSSDTVKGFRVVDHLTTDLVGSKRQASVGIILVPRAGLEPACGCPRWILSPLRLPFRHLGTRERLQEIQELLTIDPYQSEETFPDLLEAVLAAWNFASLMASSFSIASFVIAYRL